MDGVEVLGSESELPPLCKARALLTLVPLTALALALLGTGSVDGDAPLPTLSGPVVLDVETGDVLRDASLVVDVETGQVLEK